MDVMGLKVEQLMQARQLELNIGRYKPSTYGRSLEDVPRRRQDRQGPVSGSRLKIVGKCWSSSLQQRRIRENCGLSGGWRFLKIRR